MKVFIEESLLSGLSGQLPEVLAYTISGSDSLASRCVPCIKVCFEQSAYVYMSIASRYFKKVQTTFVDQHFHLVANFHV